MLPWRANALCAVFLLRGHTRVYAKEGGEREPRCPLESREDAASAREERKRERVVGREISTIDSSTFFFFFFSRLTLSLAHKNRARAFSMSPLDDGTDAGAGDGAIAVSPSPSLAAEATATVTISEAGGAAAKGGGRVEKVQDNVVVVEPRAMELAAAAPASPPPSPRAKPPQGPWQCWSA